MQVSLVMFKADGSRREFPVNKERVLIGRTNHCDLRVPLSSVSRKHCELRLSGDRVLIRDLGSSNGTFHNSNRVTESPLAAGDEIVVGPVVFTVVIDGKPEQVETVKTIVPRKKQADSPATDNANAKGELLGSSLGLADPHDATLSGERHGSDPNQDSDRTTTADLEDPITALDTMAQRENEGDDSSTRSQ